MNRTVAGDQLSEPLKKVLLCPCQRDIFELVTVTIVRREQLDGAVLLQIGPDMRRE